MINYKKYDEIVRMLNNLVNKYFPKENDSIDSPVFIVQNCLKYSEKTLASVPTYIWFKVYNNNDVFAFYNPKNRKETVEYFINNWNFICQEENYTRRKYITFKVNDVDELYMSLKLLIS